MLNLSELNLFDETVRVLGNPLTVWYTVIGTALAVLIGLLLVRKIIRSRIGSVKIEGLKLVLDVLTRTGVPSIMLIALAFAAHLLTLTDKMMRRLDAVVVGFVIVRVGLWVASWIRLWLVRDLENSEDPRARSIVTLVQFFANILIGTAVIVLLLETFGIQVRTLIAGLGIGGIAVALAVQNVLGDLMAAISIAFDKPFIVGDTLQLDNSIVGVVELIGIKTTRLRSVTGELIIVSNSDLQKSRLRNYGRLEKRSALVTFEVDKLTSAERLALIPKLVRDAAATLSLVVLERAHVTGITTTGINVEYFITVNDSVYQKFLDAQQALLLKVLTSLHEHDIRLATQATTKILSHQSAM